MRTDPILEVAAEDLWEELGGDLCICQRADVSHWCESCQRKLQLIRETLDAWLRLHGPAGGARDGQTEPSQSTGSPWPDETFRALLRRSALNLSESQIVGVGLLTRECVEKWR